MGVEETIRVVRATDEAFNERDWEAFDRLHAQSVIVYSPFSPEPTKGREAHRKEVEGMFATFPDMHVKEERTFGERDWVCSEYTVTGTHKGPMSGPGGQMIPATNKAFRLRLCSVVKVEGGEVTEERAYLDLMSLMGQLGLVPGAGQ